jgi:hypothetical protein
LSDADKAVVLPTANVDEFLKLFEKNNADGFGVQEIEETERYSNSHGLTFCLLNFQPNFELYDMVYSATDREKSLKAICERYGVKRLTMFMNQPFCEREESVTYNKKNGLDYQSRNYFPLPCNEYLDEDEMIEEKEEEAE